MSVLTGIKVAAFTHFAAGPLVAQFLGALGADVVKIESPGGDRNRTLVRNPEADFDASPYFATLNRNQRDIVLDLKSPGGREVARKLAEGADILVENFKPGALERLGFGYEAVRAYNPAIIYCTISGFPPDGPRGAEPGQDLLIQALSGLISMTGRGDGSPSPAGTYVPDAYTSQMNIIAILCALRHRDATGEGQRVYADMMSSTLHLLAQEACYILNSGEQRPRSPSGIAHVDHKAPYGTYEAADGFFVLSLATPELVDRLAGMLGVRDELSPLLSEEGLMTHRDRIAEVLGMGFRKHSVTESLAFAKDAGIWAAPVRSLREALDDPAVEASGLMQRTESALCGKPYRFLREPVHMSASPIECSRPAPAHGQHSEEILRELGYSENEIGALKSARAVVGMD